MNSRSNGIEDLLTYRRMITPVLLQFVWGISVAGTLLVALWIANSEPAAIIPIIVIGLLGFRIIFELIILVFRINETLTDIRNMALKQTGALSPPPAWKSTSNFLVDFLTFRRMIIPMLITASPAVIGLGYLIIWIYAAVMVPNQIGGSFNRDAFIYILVFGLIGFFVMVYIWRIICEFLIVLFRINDTLSEVRNLRAHESTVTTTVRARLNDFLTFRRMISPVAIQILFWLIGLVAVLFISSTGLNFILKLLISILGLIVFRVIAEISILVFRVNGTLTDIKNLADKQTGGVASAGNSARSVSDLLKFRRLILPVILQILYWVLTGVIVVASVLTIVFADFLKHEIWNIVILGAAWDAAWPSWLSRLSQIVNVACLLLGVRFAAEVFIVAFRINETATDIKNLMAQETGADFVTTDRAKMTMKDLLSFRLMITPILLQAVYWILTFGVFVLAISLATGGGMFGIEVAGGPVVRTLTGVAVVGFGLPAVRVVSEMLLIAFMFNATLTDIRTLSARQTGAL